MGDYPRLRVLGFGVIFRRSVIPQFLFLGSPDPAGFRWKMGSSAEDESSLPIDWMDGKPAPEAVLQTAFAGQTS